MYLIYFNQVISILDAMKIVARVWETKVKADTIKHCFRKAGFVLNNEDDLPLSVIAERVRCERFESEELETIRNSLPNCTYHQFVEFCEVDDNVIVCDTMSDTDIIEAVQRTLDLEEEVEEESSVFESDMSLNMDNSMINSIETISNFHALMEGAKNVTPEMFQTFYKIQNILNQHYAT